MVFYFAAHCSNIKAPESGDEEVGWCTVSMVRGQVHTGTFTVEQWVFDYLHVETKVFSSAIIANLALVRNQLSCACMMSSISSVSEQCQPEMFCNYLPCVLCGCSQAHLTEKRYLFLHLS